MLLLRRLTSGVDDFLFAGDAVEDDFRRWCSECRRPSRPGGVETTSWITSSSVLFLLARKNNQGSRDGQVLGEGGGMKRLLLRRNNVLKRAMPVAKDGREGVRTYLILWFLLLST